MDVECQLCHGERLPRLQGHRMDGDPRLRHGPPGGARERGPRSRALHRLGLRHGPAPDRACCATACPTSGCCSSGDMRFLERSWRADRPEAGSRSGMNVSLRWLEDFLRRSSSAATSPTAWPCWARRWTRSSRCTRARAVLVARCWRSARIRIPRPPGPPHQGGRRHRRRRSPWCAARPTSPPASAIRSPGRHPHARRQGPHHRGAPDPRRREPGHALLRPRARAGRGARRHPRARDRRRARHAAARGDAAGRRPPGRGRHAQPPGPARPQGRRARAAPRRTARRSACRRFPAPSALDVPPARRAGAAGRGRRRPDRHRGHRVLCPVPRAR